MNKKQLGQFFTVNSNIILKDLEKYLKSKEVTDPFAGSGELMRWAKENKAKSVRGFDIDKKWINKKTVFYNDSINNKKKYKFVLTNPPYLNVNKANSSIKKNFFSEKKFEDLYQHSLFSIMDSEEGIIIVPINFLSAENSKKIRKMFFERFVIEEMNYFKYQVFPDTTYNVIAFYYRKKSNNEFWDTNFSIKTHIYPEGKIIYIALEGIYNWSIGGKFLSKMESQKNVLGVRRLTEKDIEHGSVKIKAAFNHIKDRVELGVSPDLYKKIKSNVILLKAIDSGTEEGKLALDNIHNYDLQCLVSKESSRHMIYLILEKNPISVREQQELIDVFNKEINKLREEYFSLFLTNYRDNDRKRISFDLAYKMINHLYFSRINNIRT